MDSARPVIQVIDLTIPKGSEETMNCKGKYIVVQKDGVIRTDSFEGNTMDFFNKMKDVIGCEMIEQVTLAQDKDGNQLVMMVDEEGYMRYDRTERPKVANKTATEVYNGDTEKIHWVLGDVIFCVLVNGNDGMEYVPLSELAAEKTMKSLEDAMRDAEVLEIPDVIEDPQFEIKGFDTIDELLASMKGGFQK